MLQEIEWNTWVIDMMINSEMSNLLGVPDTIDTIASGLGYNKVVYIVDKKV